MKRTTAWAWMAVHVLGAAGTYVWSKPAVAHLGDAMALTTARAVIATVVLLAFTGWWIPAPRFRPREWITVGALGVLLLVGNQYCFLLGMQSTAPSHPALLYALTPTLVLLLGSLWWRRWPKSRQVFGVVTAFAGTVLLLRPWESSPDARDLQTGDLWIFIAVAAWAIYTISARDLCQRYDPRTVTSWSLILGSASILPWGVPRLAATDWSLVPTDAWVGLLWLALVTSVTMMLVWNVLLRHLSSVEVAVCTNAQPAATVLLSAGLAALGWYDGQQDLSLLYFAGMLMILVGVGLVQRRGSAGEKPVPSAANPPPAAKN